MFSLDRIVYFCSVRSARLSSNLTATAAFRMSKKSTTLSTKPAVHQFWAFENGVPFFLGEQILDF